MKLKYLFFCLILIGFMGCESESTSEGGEGTTTTTPEVSEKPSEPTYNLKWTVPNDYSFVQKGKQAEKITVNPGSDQEQVSKLSITANRKFNIGKVDKEGAFGVTMNYMGVMGEFKGPSAKWLYDSNAAKDGEKAGGLEKLSGSSVQFRIDPNTGQVIEVFDSEELANVLAVNGEKIESPDKVVREALQPEWYVFPDGAVKINEEWTREVKLKHQYQVALISTFKIASRENDRATIAFTGTATPLAKAELVMGKTENGEDFYHELSGTTSGEIVVEEASGAFISQTTTATLEGQRIILDRNGLEKQRIPIKIEMESFSEYQKN